MEPHTFGHDLRSNETVYHAPNNTYATNLFTNAAVKLIEHHNQDVPLYLQLAHVAPHSGPDDDPLQVPSDSLHEFYYIKDKQRRAYAGKLCAVDLKIPI